MLLKLLIQERFKKYYQHKFTLKAKSSRTKYITLLLSPLLGSMMVNIISIIIVGYLVITDYHFIHMGGVAKGREVAKVSFLLFGILTVYSYIYTGLIINTISKLLKHNNTDKFVFLNTFPITIISFILGVWLYDMNRYNIAYIYIPVMFWATAFFNTFTYKIINELFMRDINGQIISEK